MKQHPNSQLRENPREEVLILLGSKIINASKFNNLEIMLSTRRTKSPSKVVCWTGDDPFLASKHSASTSSIRSGYSAISESTIIVSAGGNETPMTRARMAGASTLSSPEIQSKIENGSLETTRRVAIRLYESMKRRGLREEAREAIRREEHGGNGGKVEGEEEEDDEERKKREELMGMEYLMKDGFVSYLRDMARITPPIPQQVTVTFFPLGPC